MPTSRGYSKHNAGFTLVEMLVVVGVIAVLAAIAYPAASNYLKKTNFRASARDVLTAAMEARSNAVRDNGSWQLVLDPAHNTFSLVDSTGSTVSTYNPGKYGDGVRLIGSSESSCGHADKSSDGSTIQQASTITFTGRGLIQPNGAVYLENNDDDVCYAVATTLSGAVRILRYDGTTPFSVSHWNN